MCVEGKDKHMCGDQRNMCVEVGGCTCNSTRLAEVRLDDVAQLRELGTFPD